MTIQFTAPNKFEILVNAPKLMVALTFQGKIQALDEYKRALSKCERIEIPDKDLILGIKAEYTPEGVHYTFNNKVLKDGYTFEIDDEKVSIEIKPKNHHGFLSCCKPDTGCYCGVKIAILKLKEYKDDVSDSISVRHQYSGSNSKDFWNIVNSIKNEADRQELYSLGVALQKMEEYVLRQVTTHASNDRRKQP